MDYETAKEIFDRMNGIERIPSIVMRVIVEHNQATKKYESPGIAPERFKMEVSNKDLERIINNEFEIYKYLDNKDYINYEGLINGDLVAVIFNGVNFETHNIRKYIRSNPKSDYSCINAHPPEHFHKRYKLLDINYLMDLSTLYNKLIKL